MKKNSIKIFGLLAMVYILNGCSLFGMDLQQDYDYEHSQYITDLGTDAWTFMNSRKDIFSGMLSAIEYVKDIEPNIEKLYQEKNSTYLLLTNTALTDVSVTNSYFNMNRIHNDEYDATDLNDAEWLIPTTWERFDKRQVAELLKYHVIKGLVGYGYTASTPTWYDTCAAADTAKVQLYLSEAREAYLYINNYAGVPTITIPGTTTNVTYTGLYPRTPNLIATNGIVHVVDRWFFPPQRNILGL
jgi:uncharacterized surface protein with fasciclin (FAS1) repeats